MAESRPSMQSVQRSLLVGVLLGLIFGCLIGGGLGLYYAWQVNPAVYDTAYPVDLAPGYQQDYINMVANAYLVDRQVENAQKRLQSFNAGTVILALGERSVELMANGQAVEVQAINELAAALQQADQWPGETVTDQVGKLAVKYQGDPAKMQAVYTYGDAVGAVPDVPVEGAPIDEPQAEAPAQSEEQPQQPPTEGAGGFSWLTVLYCLLGALVIVGVVLLIGQWYFKKSRSGPSRPEIEWEGEGPAPIIQWSGTYSLGQDNYDEFFTIETPDGDFLGESGVGILEAIPGSSPKQVTAFDVGLFDKTDITTLSRVLMSQAAFDNPDMQNKIDANPMAEAVLAEPGKEFSLETSALRVVARIDEVAFGGNNEYFEKLTVSLDVFVREGADLKVGEMDVPEQYQ